MPPPASGSPLVSVGIPAYNRPVELARAVRSVLAQREANLEIVVSDDASPDPAVWEVLADLAATDSRLRIHRQPANLGHAANYQWVLDEARGEYFMWLADDDEIDPDYVWRCLAALRDDPSAVLVCGQARYLSEAGEFAERPINLRSRRPGARVASYFIKVTMNGPLFGVARRSTLESIGFPPMVGGDWLLVGALAGRGTVRTLDGIHIHRSAGGLGADAVGLARSFGLSGLRARRHHLVVAATVGRTVAAGPPLFPRLARPGRLVVAGVAAASIAVRFTLADLIRERLGEKRAAALEGWVSALISRSGP